MENAVFGLRSMLGVFVLLGVVFLVYSTMSQVREGEFNLYASQAAIVTIRDFVIAKHAWPTSLEELEQKGKSQGFYSWPKDSEVICSRVNIEFGLTLKEVLSREREDFPIKPQGRLPELSYNAKVDSLVQVLKEIVREQEGETLLENKKGTELID